MPLLKLDAKTSRRYGSIRAELAHQGTPVGANDYWIAAQALAFGLVLVTDNVREFSRVPGLGTENWRPTIRKLGLKPMVACKINAHS